jgi:hypothetical protein
MRGGSLVVSVRGNHFLGGDHLVSLHRFHVVISYSHADRDAVEQIVKVLSFEHGLSVMWDRDLYGDTWRREFDLAVQQAQSFLALARGPLTTYQVDELEYANQIRRRNPDPFDLAWPRRVLG